MSLSNQLTPHLRNYLEIIGFYQTVHTLRYLVLVQSWVNQTIYRGFWEMGSWVIDHYLLVGLLSLTLASPAQAQDRPVFSAIQVKVKERQSKPRNYTLAIKTTVQLALKESKPLSQRKTQSEKNLCVVPKAYQNSAQMLHQYQLELQSGSTLRFSKEAHQPCLLQTGQNCQNLFLSRDEFYLFCQNDKDLKIIPLNENAQVELAQMDKKFQNRPSQSFCSKMNAGETRRIRVRFSDTITEYSNIKISKHKDECKIQGDIESATCQDAKWESNGILCVSPSEQKNLKLVRRSSGLGALIRNFAFHLGGTVEEVRLKPQTKKEHHPLENPPLFVGDAGLTE